MEIPDELKDVPVDIDPEIGTSHYAQKKVYKYSRFDLK